jgi:hypothetical protein
MSRKTLAWEIDGPVIGVAKRINTIRTGIVLLMTDLPLMSLSLFCSSSFFSSSLH